jgi:hypothetical protein
VIDFGKTRGNRKAVPIRLECLIELSLVYQHVAEIAVRDPLGAQRLLPFINNGEVHQSDPERCGKQDHSREDFGQQMRTV